MLDTLFSIKLIDIVSVSAQSSVSDFPIEKIEALAENFLQTGRNGIPIIVERAKVENLNFIDGDLFTLIEGDLIYFACKRAEQQNPLFGSISAIIIDEKNENFVKEQWRLLYGERQENKKPAQEKDGSIDLSGKINNLEKALVNSIDSLSEKIQKQQQAIDELSGKKASELSYLDQINNYNVVELARLLDRSWGLASEKAEDLAKLIVTERDKNGKFQSLINISERVYTTIKTPKGNFRRAVTPETLMKYIDHWICCG